MWPLSVRAALISLAAAATTLRRATRSPSVISAPLTSSWVRPARRDGVRPFWLHQASSALRCASSTRATVISL